jgi:hypothetical protein
MGQEEVIGDQLERSQAAIRVLGATERNGVRSITQRILGRVHSRDNFPTEQRWRAPCLKIRCDKPLENASRRGPRPDPAAPA